MRFLFVFFLIFGHVFGFTKDVRPLPLHSVQAEHVLSGDKKITLEGSVVAILDFGTVQCEKASVVTESVTKEGLLAPNKIEMEKHVNIQFSDGSSLLAYRGIIDCMKKEGTFYASEDQKVIYETLMKESGEKSRMKATSNFLKGKLVKKNDGWVLDEVQADGAVHIEYIPQS